MSEEVEQQCLADSLTHYTVRTTATTGIGGVGLVDEGAGSHAWLLPIFHGVAMVVGCAVMHVW